MGGRTLGDPGERHLSPLALSAVALPDIEPRAWPGPAARPAVSCWRFGLVPAMRVRGTLIGNPQKYSDWAKPGAAGILGLYVGCTGTPAAFMALGGVYAVSGGSGETFCSHLVLLS